MEPLFIVAQVANFLAAGMSLIGYWQKKKLGILVCQALANVLYFAHWFLMGEMSGALCSVFQIAVLIIFSLQEKLGWKRRYVVLPVVICLGLIGYFTYNGPYSVLPIVGSLIALISFFSKKKSVMRLAGTFAAICWLTYAFFTDSLSAKIVQPIMSFITFLSVFEDYFKNLAAKLKEKIAPAKPDDDSIEPVENNEDLGSCNNE